MSVTTYPVDSSPISFRLPDGEIIEIDGIPHEGWGCEPGKWYQVIQHDDDGNELWRRWWAIPPA